ncbi:hypothetical protein CR513_07155, partial [Mucuna pruriens]
MVLKGKVITQLEIRSPAAKFFNGYAKQLHNLSNIVDNVHEGNLHEGNCTFVTQLCKNKIKHYKMFKLHLQVIDKEEGGAVTDITPPYRFLDIITVATKDIDAHVLKA